MPQVFLVVEPLELFMVAISEKNRSADLYVRHACALAVIALALVFALGFLERHGRESPAAPDWNETPAVQGGDQSAPGNQ
ncbi:hypothetical protein [Methylocystis heyeri]|uniref:hypothetical protein n=1 Tax=Methylocystis heyeri TaxID=391905 RepID=UPI00138A28D8|nr:hypothetical protein [Methylocystis heyeri]